MLAWRLQRQTACLCCTIHDYNLHDSPGSSFINATHNSNPEITYAATYQMMAGWLWLWMTFISVIKSKLYHAVENQSLQCVLNTKRLSFYEWAFLLQTAIKNSVLFTTTEKIICKIPNSWWYSGQLWPR